MNGYTSANLYQRKKMTKFILATLLLAGALQAEDTVNYDKKDAKPSGISKPNHPHTDLYTK